MRPITEQTKALNFLASKGYPTGGSFSDTKAFTGFCNQLSTNFLDKWVNHFCLQNQFPREKETIYRFNLTMRLLETYFPKRK